MVPRHTAVVKRRDIHHSKEYIMKKLWFSIVLMLAFTAGFCLTVSASDTGYGSVTYVNPIYQDSNVLAEPYSMRGSVQKTAEPLYHTTFADAGEALLAGMLNKEPEITVGYQTTAPNENLFYDIFDAATGHSDIPTAGDYLKYNLGGWQCSYSYYSSGAVTYYTITYRPNYYTTAAQEAKLDEKINQILSQFQLENLDEYERSTAIYDYICENITYDYENLEDPTYTRKYTAYAALMDGTAVCQGYASLYYRMALEAGLDVRVITGIGNGGRHAWNIVKIGNVYYNLDATWDAGNGLPHDYYLRCDANFPSHERDSEMLTGAFMTAYPMSAEDYPIPVTFASGICGDHLKWNLSINDGILTISGTGAMYDYGYSVTNGYYVQEKPWEAYGHVKKLIIENGVTSIGFAAFYEQKQLTEAVIGSSVQSIGSYAFFDCTSLKTVHFAGTPPTIGDYAFYSIKPDYSPDLIGGNVSPLKFVISYTAGTDGWTTPTWKASNGLTYSTVILGDINLDGFVDIRDAEALFKYSMLPDLYGISYTGNVDFTGDGVIDIRDGQKLFQYSILPEVYPLQ